MKTCPICQAVAFDDARICFGCMHRYDDPAGPDTPQESSMHADGGPDSPSEETPDFPPAFYIKLIPAHRGPAGVSWRCSVGIAD